MKNNEPVDTVSNESVSKPTKSFRRLRAFLKYFVLPLFVLIYISQIVWKMSGSNAWELQVDKNGVKVYTLKSPGSDLLLSKATINLDSTLSAGVAFLQDHSTCQEFSCLKADMFYKASEQLYYSAFYYGMPFGLKDREFVVSSLFYQDPQTKTVHYHHISEPGLMPADDSVFRIISFVVIYKITPLENGQVEFEMSRKFDVGGYLPDYLMNMGFAEDHYELMLELKKYIEKEKYQNMQFDFIEE
jgi:hypothetical protein